MAGQERREVGCDRDGADPGASAAVTSDAWPHAYARSLAAFPVETLRRQKYWPPVGRADNVYGDRNLVCACPATSEYT